MFQMVPYKSPKLQYLIFFTININNSLKYLHNNTEYKEGMPIFRRIWIGKLWYFPPSSPPPSPFSSFLPISMLSYKKKSTKKRGRQILLSLLLNFPFNNYVIDINGIFQASLDFLRENLNRKHMYNSTFHAMKAKLFKIAR